MKIYTYDHIGLKFKQIKPLYVKLGFSFGLVMLFFILGSFVIPVIIPKPPQNKILEQLTEYEKILIVRSLDSFSEDKLISKIKELNFKFPHIVYAQSLVETGNFTSDIFKANYNLFGMKEAKVRLNLAKGTNRNHAYYNKWEDSVLDYALYVASYLRELNTEEKYLQYLGQHYAEDPNYVSKLKNLIEKRNLKQIFK